MGHDRELEPPGGFDIGVGAAQLDQRVGLAMLQRIPGLALVGAELFGHVVQDLLDQDPVEIGEPPPARGHAPLGLTPHPDVARLVAGLGVGRGELLRLAGALLQIQGCAVPSRAAPIRGRSRASRSASRARAAPRTARRSRRAPASAGSDSNDRATSVIDLVVRADTEPSGIGLERVAFVENPSDRELLDLEAALLPLELVVAGTQPGGLVTAEPVDQLSIRRHHVHLLTGNPRHPAQGR